MDFSPDFDYPCLSFFIFYFLCMGVLPAVMSVYHTHEVNTEARRGNWVPCVWSYRMLWAVVSAMGIKPCFWFWTAESSDSGLLSHLCIPSSYLLFGGVGYSWVISVCHLLIYLFGVLVVLFQGISISFLKFLFLIKSLSTINFPPGTAFRCALWILVCCGFFFFSLSYRDF